MNSASQGVNNKENVERSSLTAEERIAMNETPTNSSQDIPQDRTDSSISNIGDVATSDTNRIASVSSPQQSPVSSFLFNSLPLIPQNDFSQLSLQNQLLQQVQQRNTFYSDPIRLGGSFLNNNEGTNFPHRSNMTSFLPFFANPSAYAAKSSAAEDLVGTFFSPSAVSSAAHVGLTGLDSSNISSPLNQSVNSPPISTVKSGVDASNPFFLTDPNNNVGRLLLANQLASNASNVTSKTSTAPLLNTLGNHLSGNYGLLPNLNISTAVPDLFTLQLLQLQQYQNQLLLQQQNYLMASAGLGLPTPLWMNDSPSSIVETLQNNSSSGTETTHQQEVVQHPKLNLIRTNQTFPTNSSSGAETAHPQEVLHHLKLNHNQQEELQHPKLNLILPPKKRLKDKGKPKRPLSAYNLFFRDERAKILESSPEFKLEGDIVNPVSALDKSNRGAEYDSNGTVDMRKDRKKKTPHGKITFENLAKIIGKRWTEVDQTVKEQYNLLAKEEMNRYKEAIEIYLAKLQQSPILNEQSLQDFVTRNNTTEADSGSRMVVCSDDSNEDTCDEIHKKMKHSSM